MRYTADRLDRFTAKHNVTYADIIRIFIFATGYRASFPQLLRAFVQGRSVAGRMAGRARIVPVVSVAEGRAV